MADTIFKIGDRVRIIDCRGIEAYELNKTGTIVDIDDYNVDWITCVVDMGRRRRPNDPEDRDTCWWLRDTRIELASQPGEQLLFEFMYE